MSTNMGVSVDVERVAMIRDKRTGDGVGARDGGSGDGGGENNQGGEGGERGGELHVI